MSGGGGAIVCPSGLAGEVRGLRGKEGKLLADRAAARAGATFDQILAGCWLATADPGVYDLADGAASFTLKPHFLHARPDLQISIETLRGLDEADRVTAMFWEGTLAAQESIHYQAEELEEYLRAPIVAALARAIEVEQQGAVPVRRLQHLPVGAVRQGAADPLGCDRL